MINISTDCCKKKLNQHSYQAQKQLQLRCVEYCKLLHKACFPPTPASLSCLCQALRSGSLKTTLTSLSTSSSLQPPLTVRRSLSLINDMFLRVPPCLIVSISVSVLPCDERVSCLPSFSLLFWIVWICCFWLNTM